MDHPQDEARLRFGPSPSGDLHVGHVRNAVLIWLLARQLGGSHFTRFESTDQAREVAGAREAMVSDLEWLGLVGSEPPHDQGRMKESYRRALERLSSQGHTYDDGGAVRLRLPVDGSLEWDDLVRGRVVVRNADLVDPVLVRSSGDATFYLASTVDDIDDRVTHLLRIEAMTRLSATQLHLWRALGHSGPRLGHHPAVVEPGGRPLRQGTTGHTVRALREEGVLPTALVAYMAMPQTASWRTPPGSLEELIGRVGLSRLARRPMVFDRTALQVMNRRYLSRSGVPGPRP